MRARTSNLGPSSGPPGARPCDRRAPTPENAVNDDEMTTSDPDHSTVARQYQPAPGALKDRVILVTGVTGGLGGFATLRPDP